MFEMPAARVAAKAFFNELVSLPKIVAKGFDLLGG
jgi:hypothetical protein